MTSTTQKSPRGTRPRDRRDQIRSAAVALFYERGYEQVSVADVAESVNVGPSALYRHFTGKADLLYEAIDQTINAFAGMVADLPSRDLDGIALTAAMDKGNLEEARRWHRKLFPLCRDMLGLATNPIPIKAAMKMLGRDPGELLLPMTPLEDAGMVKLKKTLAHEDPRCSGLLDLVKPVKAIASGRSKRMRDDA